MSKQQLLAIANFNLFTNTNPAIEFSISKDERVQAQRSSYDKDKGFDVRAIMAKSDNGVLYMRLSMSVKTEESGRQYFNGALFTNEKKESDKQPDYQGSVNLDNSKDGPKLRLSAWKKTGEKAGAYLSVSIQEFLTKEEAQARKVSASAGTQTDQNIDYDDIPFDAIPPAKVQAARPPARTPAHSAPIYADTF